MSQNEQIKLATKLMRSRYGEQQSVALAILEKQSDYYTPEFFTGTLLQNILFNYPKDFPPLIKQWNLHEDR